MYIIIYIIPYVSYFRKSFYIAVLFFFIMKIAILNATLF